MFGGVLFLERLRAHANLAHIKDDDHHQREHSRLGAQVGDGGRYRVPWSSGSGSGGDFARAFSLVRRFLSTELRR